MAINRAHTTATAQRRQKQIEDCLFDNMLHTPYQSISVSDLCRQVGISRKAYYNYYHDKDECFCAYVDRLIQDAMITTSRELTDNATPLEAAVALLEYWRQKRTFFDVVVRNNLLYLVMLRNIEYVLREDKNLLSLLNTQEVQSDHDILACYMAVQQTLVLQWYSRGFDTPVEEMARKLVRILYDPMIPAAEKKA